VYLSPLDPAATAYLVNAITAAVTRYPVDGLYLEAVDFPGDDFDYSRHSMSLFRARMRETLSAAERARLDGIEAIDPFAYPEEFPDEWRQFREAALTELLGRLRTAFTAANPAASMAAAIRMDAESSTTEHYQAWRTWLSRGIVDRVGYRSRSTGTVFLSPDGVFTSTPERQPTARAAGTGGPR
jgi:uncharacterized lipoprotein YddW (UPF0748 family)